MSDIDKLKFIIQEINKIFLTDYNCSSFTSLSETSLQQVVLDVMHHLKISEFFEAKQNQENASFQILNTLEAIKYIPDFKIFPADFRNGLAEGNKCILHPILYFLLNNQDNVKQRHYLSKYVNKIDIPEDITQQDIQVENILNSYNKTIQEFWKVYTENKNEKEYAMEFSETEDDVWQMKNEMTFLHKRLQIQKNKIRTEGISQHQIETVKEQCLIKKKNEKLQRELQEENKKIESLTDEIRRYERRDKISNLEDFLERSENHKYTSSSYEKIQKDVDAEVDIFRTVFENKEPDSEELARLENSIMQLQIEINNLNEEKESKFDENIDANLKQIKALDRNKAIISKQIMRTQLKIDEVMVKIESICSLLGGDVLHGRSLKDYVANLRQLSIVYKRHKQFMNGFINEHAILIRTLEILHLQNPNLAADLQKQKDFDIKIQVECDTSSNIKEIRDKYECLYKNYENFRKNILIDKMKYNKIKFKFDEMCESYNSQKFDFFVHAGDINDEVIALSKEVEKLENILALEMEDLDKYNTESEYFKESMLRYTQDIIESETEASMIDGMSAKLKVAEKYKDELLVKFSEKREEVEKEMEELKMTMNVKEMVLLKIKEGNLY